MSGEPTHELLQVPTLVHGRCLLRRPQGRPSALLVGFHGYAERAEDSLAAMERLAAGRSWAVAAIQALHPFYRRSDQEVVAGWMTRLDRELAIEDNVAYVSRALASLVTAVRGPDPGPPLRLALVGFSQGVAMAYRAAARCGLPVHALLALAGDVPPELRGAELAVSLRVLVGRGSEDDWYTAAKLEQDLQALAVMGLDAEGHTFPGGHEWGAPFVDRARELLQEVLGP